MTYIEKFLEDVRKGNFIQRNFNETDDEFKKRVLEKSKVEMKMNNGQKYIKRKYFKVVDSDPFYYVPVWDESFHIAPVSIFKIIDIIIKILIEEKDSEINWVKPT